jgi:hypothetical protein
LCNVAFGATDNNRAATNLLNLFYEAFRLSDGKAVAVMENDHTCRPQEIMVEQTGSEFWVARSVKDLKFNTIYLHIYNLMADGGNVTEREVVRP